MKYRGSQLRVNKPKPKWKNKWKTKTFISRKFYLKDLNLQEADQLAISKAWRSWIRDYWKQTQLVAERSILSPAP